MSEHTERFAVQSVNQFVSQALINTLSSPNELDSNGEEANVVDGLFAIARSVDNLADAIRNPDGLPSDEGSE